MAHPPEQTEQSDPSEPGPPLARANPGFARRLGIGKRAPRQTSLPADYSFRPATRRLPFLKRLERYLSAILKLGRTYGTVKNTKKYLTVHETRMDGVFGTIAAIRDWQNHHEGRMHALEARVEDYREMDAMRDDLRRELGEDLRGDFREGLDGGLGDLEDRLTETLNRRFADVEVKTAAADDRASKAALDVSRSIDEVRGAVDRAARTNGETSGALDEASRAIEATAAAGDRTLARAEETARTVERLRTEMSETAGEIRERLSLADMEQAGLSRAYGDLSRRLDLTRSGGSATPAPAPEMTGLDALMESFYARLEDRYRGSREEIRQRLVKYLPEAEVAAGRTGRPVLDLGCGRGEWLELLRGRGVEATGVDLNEMQLRDARTLGLDVHLVDACRFLADAPDGAYGMITAHHLAEHLPFRTLAWLTREALRVLAPGGVLLYETPNIGNVLVGASSFHIDPTHIKPLPAPVLTTLFDTLGFHPVESRFLHPSTTHDKLVRDDRLDPVVADLMFGPQDLAVLGTKPDGAA